jgi:hypothetical protein
MATMIRVTYTRANASTPWAHEALAAAGDSSLQASYDAMIAKIHPSGSNRLASGITVDNAVASDTELHTWYYFQDLPSPAPDNLKIWTVERLRRMVAEDLFDTTETTSNPLDGTEMTVKSNKAVNWMMEYRIKNTINTTAVEVVDHSF